MIGFVISGIAVLIALLWFLRWRSEPRFQLRWAEKALGEGKISAAQGRFLRVISLVEAGKATADTSGEIASRAHLAVAEIEHGQGNPTEAVAHYRAAKTLGASLPNGAVLLIAESCAAKRETGDDVVEAYLTYLVSGPRTGAAAEQVYAALQNICQVTEDMKPAQRKPAAELNRRVIAVNPELEWAHYFLGLASLLDGRASDAIVTFGKARDLNPRRALTFYWLAVCYLQLPAPVLDEAIGMIEKFLSFAQDDSKTRKRESRVCSEIAKRLVETNGGFNAPEEFLDDQKRANLDRAIHYLEVAVKRTPENAPDQYDLGRAYRLKGARAEAVAAFRQALNLNPQEKLYAYNLGLECLKFGQVTAAIRALEQAIAISSGYEDAHGTLGGIYFMEGSDEKAVAHLHIALVSGKRNPRLLGLLVRALCAQGNHRTVAEELDRRKADPSPLQGDVDAAYAAGRSYSALSRFEEALGWLRGVNDRPDATYFLGCVHANLKQYAEAMACFDELSRTGGEWASRASLQRGHVLQMLGDDQGAVNNYGELIAADPNNVEALKALGELALVRGDLGEAVLKFSAALAIRPENCDLRFALGLALERKGDLEEALRNYEAAAQDGAGSYVLLRIGVIRCRLGEFVEALRSLDLSAQPGNVTDTLLFYHGLANVSLGRYEEAIRDWSELEKGCPGNERLQLNLARARYVLGTLYISLGNREAAIEQWEQYLSQYPMAENVARDIGELHFRNALEALSEETPRAIEQARECFSAALQRDPGNRTYRLYAALCDARSGTRFEGAIGTLRSLAEEDRREPAVLYHLGWCLLQDGKASEAAQMFEQVQVFKEAYDYRRYASWALSNLLVEEGKFQEAAEILMSTMVPALCPAGEVQA